jgi:hypothetical protein
MPGVWRGTGEKKLEPWRQQALMVSKFFFNKTWSTWIWELRTLFEHENLKKQGAQKKVTFDYLSTNSKKL